MKTKIPIKKYKDDPSLPISLRYELLETHHKEETEFLIKTIEQLEDTNAAFAARWAACWIGVGLAAKAATAHAYAFITQRRLDAALGALRFVDAALEGCTNRGDLGYDIDDVIDAALAAPDDGKKPSE